MARLSAQHAELRLLDDGEAPSVRRGSKGRLELLGNPLELLSQVRIYVAGEKDDDSAILLFVAGNLLD